MLMRVLGKELSHRFYNDDLQLHHSRSLERCLSHSKIPPRSMKLSGSHPASARATSTPTFKRLFPGTFFPPWQLRKLDQGVSCTTPDNYDEIRIAYRISSSRR